jgi:hypothetical protein
MNAAKHDETTMPHTCVLHTQELKRIGETVEEIHRRLFIDNGKPSMQTVLRQHTDVLCVMRWILVTVVGAVIAVVVNIISP